MTNYICVNGKKTELTPEQLRDLGFAPAGRTLAEAAEIVRDGRAREVFSIHDTITCGGYELEVIGINHDKADGDVGRPTMTLMAKTLLPAHRWHDGACERGWIDSEIRDWLNNVFFAELPDEITQHVWSVRKTTHNSYGEAFETTDELFLPSESEMFGSAIWAECEDGPRYEAFATAKDRLRFDEDGDSDWYWTRSSVRGGYSTYAANVSSYGGASSNGASHASVRVPLCFAIA